MCVRVGGEEVGERRHLGLQLAGLELGTTGPITGPDCMGAAGHSRARAAAGDPVRLGGALSCPMSTLP